MENYWIATTSNRQAEGGLFHLKHKSFQIFAFGMVDVDGMIGRLVELVEDAHVSTCLRRSSKDCQSEL